MQWHQLDHMQSAPHSKQITTPTPHSAYNRKYCYVYNNFVNEQNNYAAILHLKLLWLMYMNLCCITVMYQRAVKRVCVL